MTKLIRSLVQFLPTRRRGWGGLVLVVVATLIWPLGVLAFKPGYHETITEELLRGLGFDEDSADEAGDSNFYTDQFEFYVDGAHADNNKLNEASARLRAKLAYIGDQLNACKRRNALDALGEALHTVQDIYSHSNSVDNGHPINDLLNLQLGTARCDSANNFAPGGLVTGYFSAANYATGNQCRFMPDDMCCHRELNKDAPGETNGARHETALSAARGGTLRYMSLVEEDLRTRFGSRSEQLLNLFKRKQRTTIFVIDDTGSMSTDIAGVKAAANSFLDSVVTAGESPTLGLVTFKDTATSRGTTCNDIESLRAQINGLFASGGGDCPEAMNAGLLAGIAAVPTERPDIQIYGGRLLLATDASAGDPGMGPLVADRASQRGISIDAILTGDCTDEGLLPDGSQQSCNEPVERASSAAVAPPAPADASRTAVSNPLTSPSARTYLRALTEQTGGVLFNVARTEADDVIPTLLALGAPDMAMVATRTLQGTPSTTASGP